MTHDDFYLAHHVCQYELSCLAAAFQPDLSGPPHAQYWCLRSALNASYEGFPDSDGHGLIEITQAVRNARLELLQLIEQGGFGRPINALIRYDSMSIHRWTMKQSLWIPGRLLSSTNLTEKTWQDFKDGSASLFASLPDLAAEFPDGAKVPWLRLKSDLLKEWAEVKSNVKGSASGVTPPIGGRQQPDPEKTFPKREDMWPNDWETRPLTAKIDPHPIEKQLESSNFEGDNLDLARWLYWKMEARFDRAGKRRWSMNRIIEAAGDKIGGHSKDKRRRTENMARKYAEWIGMSVSSGKPDRT